MLSEQQCELIETALTEDVEPRKVAAYLCLHMGLTLAEVAALRWEDIDREQEFLSIRNSIGRPGGGDDSAPAELLPLEDPRSLPMPKNVCRYLEENRGLYASGACFVLSGEAEVPAFYHIQNVLSSICNRYKIASSLSATELRGAFIRRCILSGADLYSLCVYIGIKQPNVIVRRYGKFFKARLDTVAVCADKRG